MKQRDREYFVVMLGSREVALRNAAYQMVSEQVHEEFHPPPPPPEYISTTRHDFHKGLASANIHHFSTE